MLQLTRIQTVTRKELKYCRGTQRFLRKNEHPKVSFSILREYVTQHNVKNQPFNRKRKKTRGDDIKFRNIRDKLDHYIRFHNEMQDG